MLDATTNAKLSRAWRVAVLVTASANALFSLLNDALGLPGESLARVTDLYPTLFRPAVYAFSIWSLIYAASIAYAVFALRDSERHVRMHDRLAPWLVASNLLGPLWILVFRQNAPALSAGVLLANLAAAGVMFQIANVHVQIQRLSPLWRVPFAMLSAWLLVATLANVSVVLSALGFQGQPLLEAAWAVALLLGVGVVSWFVSTHVSDPVVPLVLAWGTFAIAARAFEQSSSVGVTAALVGMTSLALAASHFVRKMPGFRRAVLLGKEWSRG